MSNAEDANNSVYTNRAKVILDCRCYGKILDKIDFGLLIADYLVNDEISDLTLLKLLESYLSNDIDINSLRAINASLAPLKNLRITNELKYKLYWGYKRVNNYVILYFADVCG